MKPAVRLVLRLSVFSLGLAVAQAQPSGEPEPILHEYVRIESAAVARGKPFLPGEGGGGAELPRGIVYNDEVLPQPTITPDPGRETDFVPDDDTFFPDDRTEREGVLSYEEIFNPAIAPFKRGRAFDHVREDDSLGVLSDQLQPIPVIGNVTDPARDLFYGALNLSLQANRPHPLPSVSADSRILSYKASPRVNLRFYKDSADNFFVESETSVELRLVFLTDAPRDYFDGPIPEKLPLSSVPPHLLPTLSASQKRRAGEVLRWIGVPANAKTYDQVLPLLVKYFRSFEAGEFTPRPDGDRYLALALSRRGVCRHRAYAFTVTAQAAGIPARYVYNEAHAWVEVFVPTLGWRRIDLGGASAGLEVTGARGKPVYTPSRPDPFEEPLGYQQSYSHPEAPGESGRSGFARVTGLRQPSSGEVQSEVEGVGVGIPSEEPGNVVPSEEEGPPVDTAYSAPPSAPPPVVGTVPVTFSVKPVPSQVFRGQSIKVAGVAQGEGGPALGVRVEVYLEREDGTLIFLGPTVSDEGGAFAGEFLIPADLSPLGSYRVVVATPGDATYAPSRTPGGFSPSVP